jgi:preprotein translocase subunit SecG
VGILFVLHVIIAVVLIASILMQSGKGGGLAEGFSSAESLLGTQTNKVMVKTTAILVAIFLGLSIVLAFVSARKERSLIRRVDKRQAVTVNVEDLFNKKPSETIVINAMETKPVQPVVNADNKGK